MDVDTLHFHIADQIRDTGGIITDAARDRAVAMVIADFNNRTGLTVGLDNFAAISDFQWHQIASLVAATLLDQMATHTSGNIASSALGQAINSESNQSSELRSAAGRLRRQAFTNLGWGNATPSSNKHTASGAWVDL